MRALQLKRDGRGGYEVRQGAMLVASIVRTGSHLDDYPWDWALEEVSPLGRSRSTGVAESLRAAKDAVAAAVGMYAWNWVSNPDGTHSFLA